MSSSSTSSSRYLLAIGAIVLAAATLFVGAFSVTSGTPPQLTDHYWTAYVQNEKERMAAQRTGPRILLFGSSSTFFGIKAAEIEKATGIPTINMATHGGNGVAYTLSEARKVSRPGDVAIILVDLSTWLLPPPISRQAVAVSYGLDNDFFRSASFSDKLTILSHVELSDIVYAVQHHGEPLVKREAGGYWPLPINENGDLTLPPIDDATAAKRDAYAANLAKNYLERLVAIRLESVKTRGLEYLLERYVLGRVDGAIAYDRIAMARATNAALEAKGVHVYYAVPPSIFAPNEQMTAELIDASNGKLLGDPRDSMLPLDLMYDTVVHANRDGAERVTANLIASLCREAMLAEHCARQRAIEAETPP